MSTRQEFSKACKAKVEVEAFKGHQTVNDIATEFAFHFPSGPHLEVSIFMQCA